MKILLALVLACGFGSQPTAPPVIPPPPPPPPAQCVEACPGAIRILVGHDAAGDREGCVCECWNGQGVAAFDDTAIDLLNLRLTFARICPSLLSPGD